MRKLTGLFAWHTLFPTLNSFSPGTGLPSSQIPFPKQSSHFGCASFSWPLWPRLPLLVGDASPLSPPPSAHTAQVPYVSASDYVLLSAITAPPPNIGVAMSFPFIFLFMVHLVPKSQVSYILLISFQLSL